MKSSSSITKASPNPKLSPSITPKRGRFRENQIYGFTLSTGDEMSRDEFRDLLQKPLAHWLEQDGFWQFGSVTNMMTNGEPARRTPRSFV
jgi:hypothetical protein